MTIGVSVSWESGDAADALRAKMDEVHHATTDGLERGGQLVQDLAKANVATLFEQRTGALSASITHRLAGEYEERIAPHVIYARIQELGGTVFGRPFLVFTALGGRNSVRASFTGGGGDVVYARHVTLPPRPYLRPALEASIEPWGQIMYDDWAEAW